MARGCRRLRFRDPYGETGIRSRNDGVEYETNNRLGSLGMEHNWAPRHKILLRKGGYAYSRYDSEGMSTAAMIGGMRTAAMIQEDLLRPRVIYSLMDLLRG